MTIIDRIITIEENTAAVAERIRRAASPEDKLAVVKPDELLIRMRGNVGYIYVLNPYEAEITKLRILVDKADTIRSAFTGRDVKEAMSLLISKLSDSADPALHQEFQQHLQILVPEIMSSVAGSPDAAAVLPIEISPARRRQPFKEPSAGVSFGRLPLRFVAAVLIGIVGAMYGGLRLIPKTVTDQGISITYSGWETVNPNEVDRCIGHPEYHCVVVVEDDSIRTAIFVARFSVPADMTPAQIEQGSRDSIDEIGGTILSTEATQVDGMPAVHRYYSVPGDQQRVVYARTTIVVAGTNAYQISALSESETHFKNSVSKIDAFIRGIDLQ